ncbi:hypothetical protein Lepto7375DRAFT_7991 [Leptolyngbya sp. PCC 7375]|nr:hypothetical protein Lepto7375DRAFT_7991 [Leptolyngbya sp. PCC 7375]
MIWLWGCPREGNSVFWTQSPSRFTPTNPTSMQRRQFIYAAGSGLAALQSHPLMHPVYASISADQFFQ